MRAILISLTYLFIFTSCTCFANEKIYPLNPMLITNNWNSLGIIIAKGSWQAVNFNYAYPLNAIEIKCYKQSKFCTEAFAHAIKDHGISFFTVWNDLYPIIEQNQNFIKYEDKSMCRTSVATINLKNNTVSKASFKISDEGACEEFENDVRYMKLVDGIKVK